MSISNVAMHLLMTFILLCLCRPASATEARNCSALEKQLSLSEETPRQSESSELSPEELLSRVFPLSVAEAVKITQEPELSEVSRELLRLAVAHQQLKMNENKLIGSAFQKAFSLSYQSPVYDQFSAEKVTEFLTKMYDGDMRKSATLDMILVDIFQSRSIELDNVTMFMIKEEFLKSVEKWRSVFSNVKLDQTVYFPPVSLSMYESLRSLFPKTTAVSFDFVKELFSLASITLNYSTDSQKMTDKFNVKVSPSKAKKLKSEKKKNEEWLLFQVYNLNAQHQRYNLETVAVNLTQTFVSEWNTTLKMMEIKSLPFSNIDPLDQTAFLEWLKKFREVFHERLDNKYVSDHVKMVSKILHETVDAMFPDEGILAPQVVLDRNLADTFRNILLSRGSEFIKKYEEWKKKTQVSQDTDGTRVPNEAVVHSGSIAPKSTNLHSAGTRPLITRHRRTKLNNKNESVQVNDDVENPTNESNPEKYKVGLSSSAEKIIKELESDRGSDAKEKLEAINLAISKLRTRGLFRKGNKSLAPHKARRGINTPYDPDVRFIIHVSKSKHALRFLVSQNRQDGTKLLIERIYGKNTGLPDGIYRR